MLYIIATDILKYSNELQVAKNFRKRAEFFVFWISYFFKFLKTFINILEISPSNYPRTLNFVPHCLRKLLPNKYVQEIELWSLHVQELQAPSWVNLPSDDFLPQFRSYMSTCKNTCKKHVGYWTRPSLKKLV